MKSRLLVFTCLFLLFNSTGFTSERAARIVSIRPGAFIIKDNKKIPVSIAQTLHTGAELETDENGRISILLPDHMLLKISGNTIFTYDADSASNMGGVVHKGKVWLRGSKRKGAFNIRTPNATTAIRGTEWFVEVSEKKETKVGVLDGSVSVSNDLGKIILTSKEMALVEQNSPPVKARYLVPENAVNWTLKYDVFWSKNDYNKAPSKFRDKIVETIDAYKKNDLSKAFSILSDAQSIYGEESAWWALKGSLELISGNDITAEKAFKTASEKDPAWALPISHLALMRLVENKIGNADVLAGQALKIEPNSPVALIAMAYIKKGQLQLEEAYGFAQRAVNISPSFDEGRIVAARIALEMEDLKQCKRFLGQTTICADTEVLQGYLLLRSGNNEKALGHFERSISLDPEQVDALIGKGIAHFNLDDEDKGVDAIIQATLISPQISSSQSYLAKAYLEQKEYGRAEKSLNRAKRLDPKDPTPYLYESLYLFEKRLPGKALASLHQARALNKNRAVFRSGYLLDQDQAVLMSNVASLYRELGFNYASIRNASHSIHLYPTNASAYRRLFFSDVFSIPTKPLYQQSMETNKLLSKLLAPPGLNSIIFTPTGLSPYQKMFSTSGTDFLISGNYLYNTADDTDLSVYSSYLSVAFKPKFKNLAGTISISPNYQETKTSLSSFYKYDSTDITNSSKTESDLKTLPVAGFIKFQPTTEIDIFAEFETSAMSRSMETFTLSETLTDSEYYYSDTKSTTDSNTDGETTGFSFNTGIHIKPAHRLHILMNYFIYDNKDDMDNTTNFNQIVISGVPGFPETTTETPNTTVFQNKSDNSYQIFQSTLWKETEHHFIETGFRIYQNKNINDAVNTSKDETQADFYSAFLSHQIKLNDIFFFDWGINGDESKYDRKNKLKDDHSYFSYNIGASYEFVKGLKFRTAYVKNTVGDGEKTLRRSLVAGFPIHSENSDDSLAVTTESGFHATHRTIYTAIDYEYNRLPVFNGIEFAWDKGESFYYHGMETLIPRALKSETKSLQAYIEALIIPSLSIEMSLRYADLNRSEALGENNGYSRCAQSNVSYFFSRGISLNCQYILKKEKLGIERKNNTFISELNWYLRKNQIRLNLKGKDDHSKNTYEKRNNREVSVNCYWYY